MVVGVVVECILFDLGFGFGKMLDYNFIMFNCLVEFNWIGLLLFVGLLCKLMFGVVLGGKLLVECVMVSVVVVLLVVE